jgi:hypothetical protein
MQPSREREGKPVWESAGNTVGMQPSRKREGKPVKRVQKRQCRPREGAALGEPDPGPFY